jgi:hypothetical protein
MHLVLKSSSGGLLFAALACLAITTTSGRALADQRALAQVIHGQAVDQCPTPSAVANEVWQLTPADRRDVFERLTDVAVEDLGPSYRVVVSTREGTTERSYGGPDRDCAHRARFVAVFIVLTLMPPDAPAPPAPAPSAPPPEVAPQPPAPPTAVVLAPRLSVVRLELMAVAHQGLAVGRARGVFGLGGRLQTLLGSGTFAPTFGLGYTPPVHFDAGPLQGRLSRATATFGVRARDGLGVWELGVQVDAVAVLTRATGTNLARPASDSGLELGAELSTSVAWHASKMLQPFVAVEGQWIPMPHSLVAIPSGDAGTLPSLWIGASVGMALAL